MRLPFSRMGKRKLRNGKTALATQNNNQTEVWPPQSPENATGEQDPVRATVETIADLHRRHVSQVDPRQRELERLTAAIGRPRVLYLIIALMTIWVVLNLLLIHSGQAAVDVPPFFWLQGFLCGCSLLVTVLILITQNRQDRSADRRSQLDLQVSLLIDQKVTKLIALVEELRHDLPNVRDRLDHDAEQLSQKSDIAAIVVELNELLDEAEAYPAREEEPDSDTEKAEARSEPGLSAATS